MPLHRKAAQMRMQASPDVNSREVFSWPSPVVYLAVMKEGAWPHTWALPCVALNTCRKTAP